jgi:hypothetical protein
MPLTDSSVTRQNGVRFTAEQQAAVGTIHSAAEPRWNVFQMGVRVCSLHVMRVEVLGRLAIESRYRVAPRTYRCVTL